MRGASALARLLARRPARSLRAFVVWEPIVAGDIAPPGPALVASLRDRRVRRFWDPRLTLSTALLGAGGPWRAAADRVGGREVIWDVVALFPAGTRWGATAPAPSFSGGPVIEAVGALARRLDAP